MGLTPATFWALSLPEWRAVLEARLPAPSRAMTGRDLERLMQLYPDRKNV
jgi:hypothetical protein